MPLIRMRGDGEDVVKEVIEADRAVKAREDPKGVESRKDRSKPKNKVMKASFDHTLKT